MSNLNQAGVEAAAKVLAEIYRTDHNLEAYMDKELYDAFLVDAKAAISAYLECVGDGWKDIESAPKDGTFILIYNKTTHTYNDKGIKFDYSNEYYNVGAWQDKDKYSNGDYDYDEGFKWRDDGLCEIESATHWQPLPNPPTTGDSR